MFCSLRLPGNLRVLIAERPGLWMSENDLEAWASPCREIARQSLEGAELDYGVFRSKGSFWSEAIITLIEDSKTGQALAFNVMRLLPVQLGGQDEDVLHLGAAVDGRQRVLAQPVAQAEGRHVEHGAKGAPPRSSLGFQRRFHDLRHGLGAAFAAIPPTPLKVLGEGQLVIRR